MQTKSIWLCWFLAQQHIQDDPTSVKLHQGQDCGQAIQSSTPPNSGDHLRETLLWGGDVVTVEDKVRSQIEGMWDCSQFITVPHCPEIVSNDYHPYFSTEGAANPHHHTAINATIWFE